MSNDLSLYLELKKVFDNIFDYQLKLGDALAHLITKFEQHDTAMKGFIADVGSKLNNIERKEVSIMATLDQVLADVQAESTLIGSISQLISGLQQQLNDILAGNLPPAVQAKVDAVFTQAEANKQALADAVAANTPTPTPTPAP